MPRKNPEHDHRMIVRLPRAMHEALKWTAKNDKQPLSDWVRSKLQMHCYSLRAYSNEATEELIESESSRHGKAVATRPATGLAESNSGLHWNGGRKDRTMTIRSYTDVRGNKHLGSLPPDSAFDKDRQDLIIERGEARRELTTWLNRWARAGKTLRMTGKELRLAQRLLASFDDFDKDDGP